MKMSELRNTGLKVLFTHRLLRIILIVGITILSILVLLGCSREQYDISDEVYNSCVEIADKIQDDVSGSRALDLSEQIANLYDGLDISAQIGDDGTLVLGLHILFNSTLEEDIIGLNKFISSGEKKEIFDKELKEKHKENAKIYKYIINKRLDMINQYLDES